MKIRKKVFFVVVVITVAALCGCSLPTNFDITADMPSIDDLVDSSNDTTQKTPSSDTSLPEELVPSSALDVEKGTRDNTPICLIPVAEGTTAYSSDVATVDASHANEGYVMVAYFGQVAKVKLQITGSDKVTYTYNLSGNGVFEAFPLSSGDGSYKIAVYENITGSQYSTALSQSVDVTITNEFGPFLYPNQYVNFTSASKCTSVAEALAKSADTDLDVVSNIYNYVVKNISYDFDKASTVQSGYIPVVDSILDSGIGICLDYAAVMSSMLRSQRIPTRLEVGYAGEAYHAWISTYIEDIGWVNGIIEFDGVNWELMDPTFASTSSEKALRNFIGDGDNYTTKYIY